MRICECFLSQNKWLFLEAWLAPSILRLLWGLSRCYVELHFGTVLGANLTLVLANRRSVFAFPPPPIPLAPNTSVVLFEITQAPNGLLAICTTQNLCCFFSFLLGIIVVPRQIEDNAYNTKLWGTNKMYYRRWANGE